MSRRRRGQRAGHGGRLPLVDADSKEMLVASALGAGGDALYMVMKRAMHIHPSVSELIPTVLGKLHPL